MACCHMSTFATDRAIHGRVLRDLSLRPTAWANRRPLPPVEVQDSAEGSLPPPSRALEQA